MFVCLCERACVMQYIVCVHMDVCKVGKDNESSMSSIWDSQVAIEGLSGEMDVFLIA